MIKLLSKNLLQCFDKFWGETMFGCQIRFGVLGYPYLKLKYLKDKDHLKTEERMENKTSSKVKWGLLSHFTLGMDSKFHSDGLQILLLILRKFKRIN